jgi:hypothetical protein
MNERQMQYTLERQNSQQMPNVANAMQKQI